MSNRYSAAVRISAAPAAAAVFAELRAGARRLLVEEIGVFLGAATATGAGLVRATAQGTGGTATLGQAEDPGMVATTGNLVAPAYTLAPTAGANFLRRAIVGAAIGGGLIWTWPPQDRLVVPASGSLVLTNIAAAAGSAVIDVYAVFSE